MIRPIVWMVVWVDGDGSGHGSCGHRHPSPDEATACPWEPAELPAICAGLVREVRDPLHVTRGQEIAAERDRREPSRQVVALVDTWPPRST